MDTDQELSGLSKVTRGKLIETTDIHPQAPHPRFPSVSEHYEGRVCLGNGTEHRVKLERVYLGLMISIDGGRTMYFSGGWTPWPTVRNRLRLIDESDAQNMADFINCQNETNPVLQGMYEPKFLKGWGK